MIIIAIPTPKTKDNNKIKEIIEIYTLPSSGENKSSAWTSTCKLTESKLHKIEWRSDQKIKNKIRDEEST